MPINISYYEISDFESNHCEVSSTTLEMPAQYSMREPNTDHRQGRPEREHVLQFLEEVQFRNIKGKGRLVTRENLLLSQHKLYQINASFPGEPSSSSTSFVAPLNGGGAAWLLIVCSALGWMALSKFRAPVQHTEGEGTDWPRGAKHSQGGQGAASTPKEDMQASSSRMGPQGTCNKSSAEPDAIRLWAIFYWQNISNGSLRQHQICICLWGC